LIRAGGGFFSPLCRGLIFCLLGSVFDRSISDQVNQGQEIFSKNLQIYTLGFKNSLQDWSESSRYSPLFTAGQKYAWFRSIQGPSLIQSAGMTFELLNMWTYPVYYVLWFVSLPQ